MNSLRTIHSERPHQGQGNVLLFPQAGDASREKRPVICREKPGGLLKYYAREA
jgi:hypothetical protein